MTEGQHLDELCKKLSIKLGNKALYRQALTHGSSGESDYQRLEFLGDRVLGLCIAALLYARFPDEPEGKLSARLNALVTGEVCALIARENDLAGLVVLGKQANDDGGRESDNILGDIVESLIGAVYLDRGIDAAHDLIARLWGERIDLQVNAPQHPKSALQEWAAANRRKPPEYRIVDRGGPPHAPHFKVSVTIPNLAEATGAGTSKQEAEKEAAKALLSKLENGVTS